jgi:hypothetical protein
MPVASAQSMNSPRAYHVRAGLQQPQRQVSGDKPDALLRSVSLVPEWPFPSDAADNGAIEPGQAVVVCKQKQNAMTGQMEMLSKLQQAVSDLEELRMKAIKQAEGFSKELGDVQGKKQVPTTEMECRMQLRAQFAKMQQLNALPQEWDNNELDNLRDTLDKSKGADDEKIVRKIFEKADAQLRNAVQSGELANALANNEKAVQRKAGELLTGGLKSGKLAKALGKPGVASLLWNALKSFGNLCVESGIEKENNPPRTLEDEAMRTLEEKDRVLTWTSPSGRRVELDIIRNLIFATNLDCGVQWGHGAPVVIDVAPDGVAQRHGILEGDIILQINGVETEGKGRSQLLDILQQRPLTLKLGRNAAEKVDLKAIDETSVQQKAQEQLRKGLGGALAKAFAEVDEELLTEDAVQKKALGMLANGHENSKLEAALGTMPPMKRKMLDLVMSAAVFADGRGSG